jgi:shikimate 5-dehydrogenase
MVSAVTTISSGKIGSLHDIDTGRDMKGISRFVKNTETRAALFDPSGRVAVVTGGNGGIGRNIAMGLAQAGVAVAVLARNEEKRLTAFQICHGT